MINEVLKRKDSTAEKEKDDDIGKKNIELEKRQRGRGRGDKRLKDSAEEKEVELIRKFQST